MRSNHCLIFLVAVWIASLGALVVKAVQVHESRSACVASYSTSVCTGLERPLSDNTTRTVRIG